MTYKLVFLEVAKKEWDRLSKEIQKQLRIKLTKVLENPCVPKNKLSKMKDCYKIKLGASGYRLIYRIYEDRIVVQVIAIGKRDKDIVYETVRQRIDFDE